MNARHTQTANQFNTGALILAAAMVGLLAIAFVLGGTVLGRGSSASGLEGSEETITRATTDADEPGSQIEEDAVDSTASEAGDHGDGAGADADDWLPGGSSMAGGWGAADDASSGEGDASESGSAAPGGDTDAALPAPPATATAAPPAATASPAPATPTPVPNARPEILEVVPADGAIGIALNANVRVTFSEPMDKGSVESAFKLTNPALAGAFSWDVEARVMTFNPNSNMTYGTNA